MRDTAVRWISALFAAGQLLFVGGCKPKEERVFLYEFGRNRYWKLEVGFDVDSERLQQAFRLYGRKRYADAARCVRSVFDSEHGTEARILAGIIATRCGRYEEAEQHLRKAIEECPRLIWAHEALVWHLCERGDYDAAEQHAVAITDEHVCPDFWAVLEAVRERRRASKRWIIVWLLLAFLIGLIIFWRAAYVLYRMNVEKQKRTANSRCGS